MGERTFVVGVGMTKFEKPGARDWDYPDMAREAGTNALNDAGLAFEAVEAAFAGYCNGDSTSGHRAVYELGMTGIPITNLNSNCSTGSSALFMARQFVLGGLADCVLAIGFEKMARGSLQSNFGDREQPLARHIGAMMARRPATTAPIAPQMFAYAGLEYMERYGATAEMFAMVAEKNHRHSVNNPYAQFQDQYSLEEILASPLVAAPLTRLQSSPTSDGSGAAIVASERFVREHDLWATAVEIVGQAMTSDRDDTFDGTDAAIVGTHLTTMAAETAYKQAGLGPEDVQVIELHDCFSVNEVLTYEALGLCQAGQGGRLVADGATTYGGQWVVNPSGGLIAKGHPLGATGLAQCAELTWQLRGTAGARQVEGARVALQHNLGLGGAGVVTIYRKAAD